ncbi:MAG: hypothetical protein LCH44_10515 [Bacteroidetes bacterium]|jgi:3-oxoacyl-[acyl-carrier-protein] synthase-1|nr:hypothetical protein [Bacteroidota bacterium]MCB0604961.1 hypothetical protein [Saprospiraceae bacterium]HMT76363.1 hypothetical protein [Saprospiraceae bacterium]HQU95544.1 hypothetical protein [Saprospiraceae bacterium]
MPTFTTINSVELNFKGEFEDIEQQLNLLYKDSNIQYPKFFKMNQLCKIGFLAVEQLLQHHTDLISKTKPSSVATIFFSQYASLSSDHFHHQSIYYNQLPSPSVFVYTLPNILNGELAIRHGWTGYNGFFDVLDDENTDLILETAFVAQPFEYCVTGWVETDMLHQKSFARIKLLKSS